MSTKGHGAIRYVGTNAERVALETSGLVAGVLWIETDTENVFVWTGISWMSSGGGSLILSIVAKTGDYTATSSDYTILVTSSIADITITLPAAASHAWWIYNIKRMDATAWNTIIDGNAGELVEGAATITLTGQYDSVTIQCDGTGWWII